MLALFLFQTLQGFLTSVRGLRRQRPAFPGYTPAKV